MFPLMVMGKALQNEYIDNIEDREDGGTPGFLQVIKVALAIQLKEKMGVEKILKREHEINELVFEKLASPELFERVRNIGVTHITHSQADTYATISGTSSENHKRTSQETKLFTQHRKNEIRMFFR